MADRSRGWLHRLPHRSLLLMLLVAGTATPLLRPPATVPHVVAAARDAVATPTAAMTPTDTAIPSTEPPTAAATATTEQTVTDTATPDTPTPMGTATPDTPTPMGTATPVPPTPTDTAITAPPASRQPLAVAKDYPPGVYGPAGHCCYGQFGAWSPGHVGLIGDEQWTYADGTSEDAHAQWDAPNLTQGTAYAVAAYIPDNDSNAKAHYIVYSANGARKTVVVDQQAYTNAWAELGAYCPDGRGHLFVYLTNSGDVYPKVVGADAMRFVATSARCGTPPPPTTTPAPPKPTPTQTPAPAANDYPWNGLTSGDGGDQWGMAYGQCVSYTAWKIYEDFGGRQHPPVIPDAGWFPSNGLTLGPVRTSWGNASAWAVSAAHAGYRVDRTPAVGSIAQWDASSVFVVGHVAYVTAVNGDGSIDIAGYNLREDSKFSTLRLPPGGAYDTSNGHRPFFVPYPDNFLHVGSP